MRPYYYFGDGRALTALTTGQLFFVNTRARDLTPWIVHLGLWETFVDDILCALAEPGATFLDVGANQGYYAVKVGGLTAPNGPIYAFEPNPELYPLVTDNMNINGFDPRSRVFNVAAGDGASKSTLLFEPRCPGGGQVGIDAAVAGPQYSRVEIDVAAIDDLLPLDCVADLIKIDVEGYEPLVLRGMEKLLARSPGAAIVTEVSYHHWAKFGDPAALLRQVAGDRRVFRIHLDGRIEELTDDIGHALDQNMVCYMLLLPRTEAAWAKVARFAQLPADPLEAEPLAPACEGPPLQTFPERPSLARRVAGRLMRMAFPNDP
jgi:FkbM family methyltransferase